MAEEFVDLYEVLSLPVDSDRNTLRKKINELYLDAQRNLDHRTFATRVKYQELFEVTLPQARYILLDDGRRDEYNRLVHAFRAAKNGTPLPPQNSPEATKSGFTLEPDPDSSIPGSDGQRVDPLPTSSVDPEQLAREREELWKKWKTGLEEALTVEGDDRPKARSATTASPSSFTTQPAPSAGDNAAPKAVQAAVQTAPAPQPAAAPQPQSAPKTAARPKVDISFDFKENDTSASPDAGVVELDADGNQRLSPAEIEKRRTEHRRQIMKDLLVNVGLIWGAIGAAIIIVPGLAALIAFMGRYYPRSGEPLLKYNPNIFWSVGFLLISVIAFFVARELSKSMRRKKASELSFLSYEDLLKQVGKD